VIGASGVSGSQVLVGCGRGRLGVSGVVRDGEAMATDTAAGEDVVSS
jgi:hypothetical protein